MAKLLSKTAREISEIVKKIDDLEREQDKAMNAKKYNDLATDIRLLCLALQAKAGDLNIHAEMHYDISKDIEQLNNNDYEKDDRKISERIS